MVAELKSLGIELMVSVWPTVDRKSENFDEMFAGNLLIRQDRGFRVSMGPGNDVVHFDATNPASRDFIWSKVKKNYYDIGIHVFWLDEAEPEYSVYDFDIYRSVAPIPHRRSDTNSEISKVSPRSQSHGRQYIPA